MTRITCAACGGVFEVPPDLPGGRFACPHCGSIGGAPVPARPAPAPPSPAPDTSPEGREERARTIAEDLAARAWRPTGSRADAGEWLAIVGLCVGVPAAFASPWAAPWVLGGAGMAFSLLGLTLARDKLIGILGLCCSVASGLAGALLRPQIEQAPRALRVLH